MRNTSSYFVVAALSAIATLGLSNGFAQQPTLDPTVVAPEEFTTVLENERVRVVRVIVVDGGKPARHSHPDRVVIFVNQCTWIETGEDGSVLEETFTAGEVSWQQAIIHESYPNRVKDTCELLEVELK
jgi:hypothetical protein